MPGLLNTAQRGAALAGMPSQTGMLSPGMRSAGRYGCRAAKSVSMCALASQGFMSYEDGRSRPPHGRCAVARRRCGHARWHIGGCTRWHRGGHA
eukprot:359131-Chlamydomonas_euryale.AAC.4